jgi:hypothetical protein
MKFSKPKTALIAGLGWLAISAGANAAVFTVTIDGSDAIFLAGRTDLVIPPANQPWGDANPATFDGMLRHGFATPEEILETRPPLITTGITGGTVVRVLDPAIGGISFFLGNGGLIFGPEGNAAASSLTPFAGISGYNGPRQGPLVGVFLDSNNPGGQPTPSTLNFNVIGTEFAILAPGLGQVFYIGDGKTSGGVFQQFIAPTGATRLALGIPDGFGFGGVPGAYDDNDGFYQIRVGIDEIPTGVPIPAALPLFATGLGLLGLVMRRRKRQA